MRPGGLLVSEAPVFGRAGGAVAVDQVGLGNGGVGADHLQGFVAQRLLQGSGVAAVAQILDGECVAETVRVDAFDAGPLAETFDQLEQRIAGQWDGAETYERRFVDSRFAAFGDDVTGDRFQTGGAQRQGALLAALADDSDAGIPQIDVAQAQLAEFGSPDACVDEYEDDGPIPNPGGPLVVGDALAGAGVADGAVALGQDRFEIGLRQRDDGRLVRPGPPDLVDDVALDVAAADGPAPEGGEAGVDVELLFGADGARRPRRRRRPGAGRCWPGRRRSRAGHRR